MSTMFVNASISDEYWQLHPELHEIPIYYASALAKKCMSVYQTYTHAMNERIQRQISINNPFQFKHISNLKVEYISLSNCIGLILISESQTILSYLDFKLSKLMNIYKNIILLA